MKPIHGCSDCHNSYTDFDKHGFLSGYCKILKRRVYEIDFAEYNDDKGTVNYFDEIPSDCPLPDTMKPSRNKLKQYTIKAIWLILKFFLKRERK